MSPGSPWTFLPPLTATALLLERKEKTFLIHSMPFGKNGFRENASNGRMLRRNEKNPFGRRIFCVIYRKNNFEKHFTLNRLCAIILLAHARFSDFGVSLFEELHLPFSGGRGKYLNEVKTNDTGRKDRNHAGIRNSRG